MKNRIQNSNPSKPAQAKILGIGLDNTDGHKRVTQAERFAIVGGSEQVHEHMTETVIKTFETLDRRGKQLDQVEAKELKEIIEDSRPK